MTVLKHRYIPVLTIAGSDSGGGGGIQADLKTFTALGCYGTSAITAVTAQNTLGVSAIHAIPVEIIVSQITAVLNDIKPIAIKIGMLHNEETLQAVASVLKQYEEIPIILDPVSISTSGHRLMEETAVDILQQELFPMATLITPNLPEVAMLTGLKVENLTDMEAAALALINKGCQAVLVKGGHLTGRTLFNLYSDLHGRVQVFESDYIASPNTHGTGCTLSSAIAAYMAQGHSLLNAIEQAGYYVHQAIAQGATVKTGSGHGPLNHFFEPKKAVII